MTTLHTVIEQDPNLEKGLYVSTWETLKQANDECKRLNEMINIKGHYTVTTAYIESK